MLRNLPKQAWYLVFPLHSLVYPGLDPSILYKRNGYYVVYNVNKSHSFAVPKLDWNLIHMNDLNSGNGYETVDHASQKYQIEEYVELEEGDVVVDVGGFIGAFSISAGYYSDRVLLIEPDKINIQCSEYNLAANDIRGVTTVKKAISDRNETVDLNIAEDPTDHSLIRPDSECKGSDTVEAITLDELAKRYNLSEIDFLKMDAEGFEREIIQSVEDLSINKLAIDCSPEASANSDAENVCEELKGILKEQGYETKVEKKCGWEVICAKKQN